MKSCDVGGRRPFGHPIMAEIQKAHFKNPSETVLNTLIQ